MSTRAIQSDARSGFVFIRDLTLDEGARFRIIFLVPSRGRGGDVPEEAVELVGGADAGG